MVAKACSLLTLGMALTFTAVAQQAGSGGDDTDAGQGGQGSNGGQAGQVSIGSPPDTPGQRQRQQGPDYSAQRHPIYLSGKVVMDTGGPPPELVVVELVCNGQRHPEGYTDFKGRFSFEVGGDSTVALSDASVGGPIGSNGRFGGRGVGGAIASGSGSSQDLTGCEIRASLPGFRSDSIRLGRRQTLENPDTGVIVLYALDGVRRTSVISLTTLEAPAKARSSYEKALRYLARRASKPEKAVKELEKAVNIYPRFAAAWSVLGSLRLRAGDRAGAATALEKAVEVDPEYLRPYADLVRIHLESQNWKRTAALSETMLVLHPGRTQARFFKAVADYSMGDHTAAASAAVEIQAQVDADRFPQTHHILGMVAAGRSEFEKAAKEYRRYLALSPEASSAEGIRKQLHEWEVLGAIETVRKTDEQE